MYFSFSQVFKEVAQPLLRSALSGFNGILMCYGQTGTGKCDHTIFGILCHECRCNELSCFRALSSAVDDLGYTNETLFFAIIHEIIRVDLFADRPFHYP